MRQALLAENVIALLTGLCWHPVKKAGWDPRNMRLRISFEPDPRDMHLCMGVDGSVIKGLQFLGKEIGNRNGYSVSIGLVQNYEGNFPEGEKHEYKSNPRFDYVPLLKIIGGLLSGAMGETVKMDYVFKGDNLRIKIESTSLEQNRAIAAMEEVLRAYGYRNGILISISATQPQKQSV